MPYFKNSNNLRIFYKILQKRKERRSEAVDKPFIGLCHGYGSDHHSFDKLIPFLEEDFEILLWDHRGHGKSDKPKFDVFEKTRAFYTLNLLASDLHELLMFLKKQKKSHLSKSMLQLIQKGKIQFSKEYFRRMLFLPIEKSILKNIRK